MSNAKTIVGFYTCIYVFAIHGTLAQVKDSTASLIEHSLAIDSRPNEPVRIFSMRLPFRVSAISGGEEISFDTHVGNTWNPSGVLEYPDPSEPYPKHPWEATYHPPYDEAPYRYQFYSADGVIRSGTVTYTKKISVKGELYGSLTANMLVGGGSFVDILVSDQSIEKIHNVFFNQNDPFRRQENSLDRAEIKFTDRKGRTLEIKPSETYLGSADVGYRHFVDIIRGNKVLWTLNMSAQLGIPLNRAREFLSAGLLIGTAFTKQVRKKYGITLAIGYSGQHDNVMRIRPERYSFNYATGVTGYRFLLGQNIDFKNHHRLTIGIEMQGVTAPLSTKQRVTAPHLNPEDIGVQTNYSPEYWTPELPIAITNQRRSARSLIRGSEYIGLNFSYRFGKSNTAPTIAFYLQEDWTVVYDTEGSVLPFFTKSNNAQDFGVGIKWIQPIP